MNQVRVQVEHVRRLLLGRMIAFDAGRLHLDQRQDAASGHRDAR